MVIFWHNNVVLWTFVGSAVLNSLFLAQTPPVNWLRTSLYFSQGGEALSQLVQNPILPHGPESSYSMGSHSCVASMRVSLKHIHCLQCDGGWHSTRAIRCTQLASCAPTGLCDALYLRPSRWWFHQWRKFTKYYSPSRYMRWGPFQGVCAWIVMRFVGSISSGRLLHEKVHISSPSWLPFL